MVEIIITGKEAINLRDGIQKGLKEGNNVSTVHRRDILIF